MTPADDGKIDPATVAALYAEHADELQRFLLGVLRNPDIVAEVLQNSFAKALEAGHTSQEQTRKGWLFRVAFHEALAFRRRENTRHKALHRVSESGTSVPPTALDELLKGERLAAVRRALDGLPPEQRQVVHLRIYEEQTFACIAADLGLPLGTVLSRMQLALQKLRKALETGN